MGGNVMLKNITQKQLTKILIAIIPQGKYNWSEFKVRPATYKSADKNIYQIDAISSVSKEVAKKFSKDPEVDVWFYFWKKDKTWHISLDGAWGYDFLSSDAEFGQNIDMINKLDQLLKEKNVHKEWTEHYHFIINSGLN
jgi:hypothetical protein